MSSPTVVLAPVGYTGEGKEGVEIVFAGPRYVKGSELDKGGRAKESFTLWVMPSDYRAAWPARSQTTAFLLGSTTEYKAFYSGGLRTSTWPTWQDDLREVLKLTTRNGPHM